MFDIRRRRKGMTVKLFPLKQYQIRNIYMEKEKRYGSETFSIETVSNKEHLYGKVIKKMRSKS